MINFFRQWITDTLGFSKSEANGTLVLIFITLLVAILPKIYLIQFKSHEESFKADHESLDQWAAEINSFLLEKQKVAAQEEKTPEPKSFSFDPNTATFSELVELGLGERASKNLISYREKGGELRTREDLKKIYGIPQERVDELWSYIKLPKELPEINRSPKLKDTLALSGEETPTDKPKISSFNINTATAEQLQQIHGIGPSFSKRIIKYRDKLGGFYTPDQLFEVWGLKEEAIEALLEYATFEGEIQTIDLNTDSLKHFYMHPYIDYNISRAIMNYRKQRGELDSVAQIKAIKIISDSLYQKIYPYLSRHP